MSPDDVPESTLPYPTVHKDKKFVVLSDWYVHASESFQSSINPFLPSHRDGTITTDDSNNCALATPSSVLGSSHSWQMN